MNIKDLREIVKLMKDNKINELEYEEDQVKIKLKRGNGVRPLRETSIVQQVPMAMPQQVAAPAPAAAPAVAAAPAAEVDDPSIEIVKSPMVGSYYSAPAPNAAQFIKIGQEVNVDDTLCIVEAMKLMNEIKCEIRGTIVDILVSNGQAVEFDQPMFKIKKA